MRNLTEQEELLVDAYFSNGFDAHMAAKIAGYSDKQLRTMSAVSIIYTPHIKKAIETRLEFMRRNIAAALRDFQVNPETIIREYTKLAFAPIAGGNGLDAEPEFRHLPPVEAKDKRGALNDLSRINAMFQDSVTVRADESILNRLHAGRQQARLEEREPMKLKEAEFVDAAEN